MVGYLERRKDEDVFPAYYRMNEPQTIARVSKLTGFEAEELRLIGSCGELDRLGPISWVECLLLKGIQDSFHGILQPDVLGVLKRKAA